jgi:hypothetical protein
LHQPEQQFSSPVQLVLFTAMQAHLPLAQSLDWQSAGFLHCPPMGAVAHLPVERLQLPLQHWVSTEQEPPAPLHAQTPLVQVPQTLPQVEQLYGSLERLAQLEPQKVCPAGHLQTPFTQLWVP